MKNKNVQKMFLCLRFLGRVKPRGGPPYRTSWNLYFVLLPAFAVLFFTTLKILSLLPDVLWLKLSVSALNVANSSIAFQLQTPRKNNQKWGQCHLPCSYVESGYRCNSTRRCPIFSPPPMYTESKASPYHNWKLFNADYQEMLRTLKIFVYPDAFMNKDSSPFARVFLPHPNPLDPKIGNYFSEHAFKLALLKSSLITQRPEEAHFFFMPFSINAMRNHPLLHSELSISNFIARYILRISSEFEFWNASGGSDHFFICCHSVGREAASNNFALHNNAIQITCSSSYFQRFYTAHKDIALPQVWPRTLNHFLNPLNARNKLVFFAGRVQNSRIRKEILSLWANDTSFSIFSGHPSFPYEEGFRRSKYCLHVKGYEVNTARVSDSIHYGCIPVLISDHYDLPFANVLDWSKFSIIVSPGDIGLLKYILTSVVSQQMYMHLYQNLCLVKNHFRWHTDANVMPTTYDSFHMTAYQLWLRRGMQRFLRT